MIQEYETKPAENCRLETHNCYADIQWIISGEEEIDTVSRTGLETDEEYDEKRDVAFWKEPEEMCQSILKLVLMQYFLRALLISHRCVLEKRLVT